MKTAERATATRSSSAPVAGGAAPGEGQVSRAAPAGDESRADTGPRAGAIEQALLDADCRGAADFPGSPRAGSALDPQALELIASTGC